jgi:hypothetical protein
MVQKRRHAGVVAIGLPRLDREAFGQVTRTDTGGIEALDDREISVRLPFLDTELPGEILQCFGQIAGIIDRIDDAMRDSEIGSI